MHREARLWGTEIQTDTSGDQGARQSRDQQSSPRSRWFSQFAITTAPSPLMFSPPLSNTSISLSILSLDSYSQCIIRLRVVFHTVGQRHSICVIVVVGGRKIACWRARSELYNRTFSKSLFNHRKPLKFFISTFCH